jgi:hypothetical protein
MQEYASMQEFLTSRPLDVGDTHDLMYIPGYRLSRFQDSGDVIAVGTYGKVIALGALPSDDHVYAAQGAMRSRLEQGPYSSVELEELSKEVSALSQDMALAEKTLTDYSEVEQQRRDLQVAGSRVSYKVVRVNTLPSVNPADLQRRSGEHDAANWQKINAVAISYLSNNNDPLDHNHAERYARQMGLDAQESKWLRSIFADAIRYDTTNPTMYTNGRHRSLAMAEQGVLDVVIQDENIINEYSQKSYQIRQSAIDAPTPQSEISSSDDVDDLLTSLKSIVDNDASLQSELEVLAADGAIDFMENTDPTIDEPSL